MPPSLPAGLLFWFAPPVRRITVPLAVLVLAYCWFLWPQWSRHPDLTHGFLAPLIFALLLADSRRHGTRRWLRPGPVLAGSVVALGGASISVFALAGLLAASVGWNHALVSFLLAGTLVLALLAGLLALADARLQGVPLNWPSLTAVGLWLLSAPLPLGTYARLTLLLQGWITTGVLHSLHLLGIPARQSGNLIYLAQATVGIEEACSGIRSLLSCIYAGWFFSAWQVRGTARRALLLVLAPLLAVALNFLRSLTLTLLTQAGVNIAGFWHDATGYAVLGLTALLLAGVALRWSTPVPGPRGAAADTGVPGRIRSGWLIPGTVGMLAALAVVFAVYGRSSPTPSHRPAPDVATLLPAPQSVPDWHVQTNPDLYQFSHVLQTTRLAERTYWKEIGGRPVQVTVYVAHWTPGQAPVSLVASHTPDACWPGAGWVPQADPAPQMALPLDGGFLPPAEHRVFLNPRQQARQVWFWHVYDGRVISYRNPRSIQALLELALRYGFRREGGQYFIRISSNVPWSVLAGEPLVRQLFTNLGPVGLQP